MLTGQTYLMTLEIQISPRWAGLKLRPQARYTQQIVKSLAQFFYLEDPSKVFGLVSGQPRLPFPPPEFIS